LEENCDIFAPIKEEYGMKIHFYLRFHTKPGQSLSVLGNFPGPVGDVKEQAIQLQYLNNEYWHVEIETDAAAPAKIHYKYILTNEDGFRIIEWGDDKTIDLGKSGVEEIELHDTWNHAGEFENVFYADPFQKVLLKKAEIRFK
jgi:4-alpha-glucanotransferase